MYVGEGEIYIKENLIFFDNILLFRDCSALKLDGNLFFSKLYLLIVYSLDL